MTEIRTATPDDERVLAEISYLCWAESNDPGDLWARERPFFGPPADALVEDVIVASIRDDVIGYVRSHPEPSPYGDWYIAGLGVHPRAQGRGVGRSLVDSALRAARLGGGHQVWLKVLSSNEPGLALYGSVGLRETARFKEPFATRPGVDDLRLSIELSQFEPRETRGVGG